MKLSKLLFSLFFISFISTSFAQTWSPVGSGMNGNVYSLYAFDSLLYAGGTFTTAGGNPANNIAQWDDTNWSALGKGVDGTIYAITMYNGNIYVGGKFDSAGGIATRNIAMWNGTSWAPLGIGMSDTVRALIVNNGKLYVGGCFDSAGGLLVNCVAEWNGTAWDSMSGGVNGHVYAFTAYGSNIIAGGLIDTASIYWSTNNYMQEWNGINWIGFGDSTTNFFSHPVYAITYFDSTLFCGGTLADTTGGRESSYLTTWIYDGSFAPFTIIWSEPGGPNAPVYSMVEYDSVLYIGGQFDTTYGWPTRGVASCSNDTGWSAWDTVGGGVNGTVYALATYKGQLYAGGAFTDYYSKVSPKSSTHKKETKNSSSANHIASYKAPIITGVNNTAQNNSIKVFPNPSNGKFTIRLNGEKEKTEIEIFNVLGENIYTNTLQQTQGNNQIDLSNQPADIYMYRIITQQGKFVASGKLIIE